MGTLRPGRLRSPKNTTQQDLFSGMAPNLLNFDQSVTPFLNLVEAMSKLRVLTYLDPTYGSTLSDVREWVFKLMQIMHEKKLVSRERSGKAHIYCAIVSEGQAQQQLVDQILDTAFGGSAMKLVMQALGNSHSSPEEIQQIRAFLDQIEEEE